MRYGRRNEHLGIGVVVDTNGNTTAVAASTDSGGTVHLFMLIPGSGVWDRTRSTSGTWASNSLHVDTNGSLVGLTAAGLTDGTIHLDVIAS